jgi:tRNA uridine 5-carboxymethylaminomethyl modification enzyme
MYERKQTQKTRLRQLFDSKRVRPGEPDGLSLAADDRPLLFEWLRRPEARIDQIRPWLEQHLGENPAHGVLTTVETEIKYAGYIQQQERNIGRLRQSDARRIPPGFSFRGVPGLSREVQEKLTRVQPATLGQAARIPGVTPAAVAVLDVYLSLGSHPA